MQFVQVFQPNDFARYAELEIEILIGIVVKNVYYNRIFFTNNSSFHVSGMVKEAQCSFVVVKEHTFFCTATMR